MLTDITIRQLQPDSRKILKLSDGGRNGLNVLCHPSGRKVFVVRYAHPKTRKEQTLTLGEYPYVSLKLARERAEVARSLRKLGIDPREAEKHEREVSRSISEDTFERLAIEWIKVRGGHWSDGYRHKINSMLNRHLFPKIGAIPITQISAPLLLSHLRPIEAVGKTDLAHTLLDQIGAIFRYSISTGRATKDPASALRGALRPHQQKNFPAITTPREFAELLRAIDGYEGEFITRAALEFTMLTFQRSQSVRLARWGEIDWGNKMWRIPAIQMKLKQPHEVPLSTQALVLLKQLLPLTGDADFIFPCLFSRKRPISENTMLYALVRLGYKGRMCVHGFRSAASTLLNENGFNPDVIEAALAHVKGDIRSIYNRARYLPERAKMYQWWADYCDEMRKPCSIGSPAYESPH